MYGTVELNYLITVSIRRSLATAPDSEMSFMGCDTTRWKTGWHIQPDSAYTNLDRLANLYRN
jgi:hypothetical protein